MRSAYKELEHKLEFEVWRMNEWMNEMSQIENIYINNTKNE